MSSKRGFSRGENDEKCVFVWNGNDENGDIMDRYRENDSTIGYFWWSCKEMICFFDLCFRKVFFAIFIDAQNVRNIWLFPICKILSKSQKKNIDRHS